MSELTSPLEPSAGPDRTRRVAVAYTAAYPGALVVSVGARLSVEPGTAEYPGWVWCRDSPGTAAWVPTAFLEISGTEAIVTADYDSTELTVVPGDEVEVLSEMAGWVWCRRGDGSRGWVPAEHLITTSS